MQQAEYREMELVEKTHFWFVAKRKFLQIILDKYISKKNIKALDVGCGTGAVMDFLREKGWWVEGVDNNKEALDYCRHKNLKVELGSAEKMSYEDDSFDLVLALDVLEHLPYPLAGINEIRRILKPGGIFIATVPAHQWLWSYHDVALHHYKRYSKDELKSLFDSNFKISLITWIHLVILLPVTLIRQVSKIFDTQKKHSDVRKIRSVINKIGAVLYLPELIFFKTFGKLPFGVSLLVVVEKK